jgi:hypothetical protein
MKLPFTIPKMKLSKLERFLRGVCRVYTIPDKHPCVYGGCGFVSAEYVGHVFDYGVSVYTCRLSWAFFTFCGVRTDPPQFGCSNIYV